MVATLLAWIVNILLVGAALGCIHMVLACVLVRRFARRRTPDVSQSPPVSILQPVHGSEPRLLDRCASLCRQNYAGPVQLVLGTHDPADPAIEVIGQLQKMFPGEQIALKIDSSEHGTNRKISNLMNMMPLARHDIIVTVDSDIEVGPHYLSMLVAALGQPGVGVVTCVYHGVAGGGLWSRLSAIGMNTHFLPDAVTALSLNLAQPCFGASIAVHRATLVAIGGFAAFVDCLADDYMIGRAVRSVGHRVFVPPFTVGHVCFENDFNTLLGQQVRSARTIRSIDPLGHGGAVLAHPVPLALIAAFLGSSVGIALSIVALACRMLLAFCVGRAFRLKQQDYLLIPLQEIMLFAVYVLSLLGRRVTWRGRRYVVSSDGRLIKLTDPI